MSNVEAIKKALAAAEQFIVNGVELGYIRMPAPETPDSAHDTLPMIRHALTSLEALQRENEALKRHVEELQEKIDPEKDCACSYDEAGVVCAAHSPMLKAAEAEVRRLQVEIDRKSAMPGDHRYWEGRYRDEAAENERLREIVERAQSIVSTSTYPNWHDTARQALASAGEEHHADK